MADGIITLSNPQSYKKDLSPFTYARQENYLVEWNAEARKLGVSYGQYSAMVRDGVVEALRESG